MIDIIEKTMRREGWDKYTNRASDRGGPTKWGITQKAWSDYIKRPATIPEVQSITEQQAREFYFSEFMRKPRFDLIVHPFLREFVFDCGVNHGTRRAACWLQASVQVSVDGDIGPLSLQKVNVTPWLATFLRMVAIRQRFYAHISSDQLPADPDLPNLKGWINRAAEFLDEVAAQLAPG